MFGSTNLEEKFMEELRRDLEEIKKKTTEMHAVIFGVEGIGGLQRWVIEHEKELKTLNAFRWKTVGYAGALSAVVTVLVEWLGKK